MTPDKDFTPPPLSEGDELFPNGIFEFNITKMLAYIEADSGGFPAGETEAAPLRGITPERLDEKTIRHAGFTIVAPRNYVLNKVYKDCFIEPI